LDEEAEGGAFVGVGPEPLDLPLEVVGLEEPVIEVRGLLKLVLLEPGEIVPAGEEEPAFSTHDRPELPLRTDGLLPAGLVHGGIHVFHDVKLVEDYGGLGQGSRMPLNERLPHIHADGADEPASPRGEVFGEETVEGLALRLGTSPDRLARLKVRDPVRH
jgi:hypothetical protein